jgi:hypothetical protein
MRRDSEVMTTNLLIVRVNKEKKMGCRHNTGWFDDACALCKSNDLATAQIKQNDELAQANRQSERDATERHRATQAQTASMDANAEKRHREVLANEQEKTRLAQEIKKQDLAIEGTRIDFEMAKSTWDKNPSLPAAMKYAQARISYFEAIGRVTGFHIESLPSLYAEYRSYDIEPYDGNSAVSLESLKDEWEEAQSLTYVASLSELFSANDPILEKISSGAQQLAARVNRILNAPKNIEYLASAKVAREERMAREQAARDEVERIRAEEWETGRPLREKTKQVRLISILASLAIFLVPFFIVKSSILWAPFVIYLAIKVGRLHLSQFFLPSPAEAKDESIAKIMVFKSYPDGLLVAVPVTLATLYVSIMFFDVVYANVIVAIVFGVIMALLMQLNMGDRNITRLYEKQSLPNFALTLANELFNFLRNIPERIRSIRPSGRYEF